jgi:hypothetical protein
LMLPTLWPLKLDKPISITSSLMTLLAGRRGKKQSFGAADKGIATLVETERALGSAGDADANGFGDGAGGSSDGSEPQRARVAQVQSIMTAINPKSGGQTSGAAGEIEQPVGVAMILHELDAIEWFEGANENGGGGARRLTHDIEHEVGAVVEKNINVALGKIHGADARGWATEMVASGITGRIGLGFDDAAAEASGREIMDDDFADEEAREGDGARGKFGAPQGTYCEFCRWGFDGGARGRHGIATQQERTCCRSSVERRS